ncbi:MAG TPA: FliM/FliN family flagellar motor switch protein [Candidatus Acidoferrales bacterium]|nr:FliM/FliN family flagellar motor switch protein [Candidatus Acidoferrales bacterium]
MRKTLTQSEIDALFSKAQASQGAAPAKPARNIVKCDLGRWNQLSAEQVNAVTTLHESFARRLSGSLGAHLRVAFGMNLVSVEQLTYREFLGRLPDLTFFASLHVMPIDVRAGIQMDMSLAYPIIDVLLGGSGGSSVESRDLTEIEEEILETVFRLILQDLQATWTAVLDLDFRFESRQRNLQVQNMMLPGEKVLCISFEMHLSEASGTLAMVFPAVVASALLRRLSLQWSFSERIPSRESRRRMRERLLDSRFAGELSLPPSALPVRQLIHLEPGHVLMMPKSAGEPVHLNVAGKPMFLAYPVRHGVQRGAKILDRIPLVSPNSTKQDP